MKSYQVKRTHLSPYQQKNFTELEKMALEGIPGIRYLSDTDSITHDLILVTNTHTDLALLPPDLLKKTKLIVHPNSGYDHFEKDFSLWAEIPIVVGHTIRAPAVAEYTLGCLFQGTQEMPQHLRWDKSRLWPRKLIRNMDVWVYGHGHIGSIVAETLKRLGAKVTVIDPFKKSLNPEFLTHWSKGQREKADAHLLCLGLNSSSHHLLNEEFFSGISKDAIIVNGARGKLIDEQALRYFLQTHPEAQAFLDVFEKEPFGEEWHHFPQTWKTSHIAGVSRELDERILNFEVSVIRDFTESPESFRHKYKHEMLQNKFFNGVLV